MAVILITTPSNEGQIDLKANVDVFEIKYSPPTEVVKSSNPIDILVDAQGFIDSMWELIQKDSMGVHGFFLDDLFSPTVTYFMTRNLQHRMNREWDSVQPIYNVRKMGNEYMIFILPYADYVDQTPSKPVLKLVKPKQADK
jgi:hypothetical protein